VQSGRSRRRKAASASRCSQAKASGPRIAWRGWGERRAQMRFETRRAIASETIRRLPNKVRFTEAGSIRASFNQRVHGRGKYQSTEDEGGVDAP